MKRVEAVDLTRTWGRSYALKKASFTLEAGVVTAVIGHNGAGKTTAFNLLSRRLRPTSGRVLFDGAPATGAAEHRRACGYLSHASFLYGALSARENLALVAGLHRLDERGVDPVLERVGLARAADRPVRALSRGMVQRLALGRLLLTDPSLVLLDEPASGLDDAGRRWLAGEIRALALAGKVVAMSSHSRSLVGELASRAVVLSRGRVVYDGAVDASRIDALFEEHIG